MAKKRQENPIERYKRLHESAKEFVDTALFHSDVPYRAAAEKHLRDKKTKKIIYKRLDDAETARKFADTIVATEIKDIKEELKLNEKIEPEHEDFLLLGFRGMTRDQYRKEVLDLGEDYTLPEHRARRLKYYNENVRPLLMNNAAAKTGIKDEENIEDIIKYVGVEKKVEPKAMTPDHAYELLVTHIEQGAIGDKFLKRQTYYKKAEEKKKKKAA